MVATTCIAIGLGKGSKCPCSINIEDFSARSKQLTSCQNICTIDHLNMPRWAHHMWLTYHVSGRANDSKSFCLCYMSFKKKKHPISLFFLPQKGTYCISNYFRLYNILIHNNAFAKLCGFIWICVSREKQYQCRQKLTHHMWLTF